MRNAILGVIVGLIFGLAFTVFSSLIAQEDSTLPRQKNDLIGQLDRIIKTHCSVWVGQGHRATSTRCPQNRVVTGIDGNGFFCSNIVVECFGQQILISPNEL